MSRIGRTGAPAALALIVVTALISGPWGTDTDRMRSVPPAPGIPGDPRKGERLFRKLDCIRCHSEPGTAGGINVPPPLSLAGSRANIAWTVEYLLDPHPLRYRTEGVLPDLRMPRAAASRDDAVDLAAFLAGQTDTAVVPSWSPPADGETMSLLAEEGAVLFRQYQCLGCHELGGEGRRIGPALDEVGDRRRPDYIRALLLDPQRVVPGTSMKDFDLWEEEADALAIFLGTLTRENRQEAGDH
jgi:cytochrome c2